jgi:cytoskeletal protein CcmA (bactofilin family)
MKTKDEINAFLGVNTEFEGKLSFTGAVRVDGRFKGEINTKGTLIVGELAVIESNVFASHIIVNGEIRGNITAEKRMEINSSGKVSGNIQTPVLVINEGVVFNGNCSMEKPIELTEKAEDKVLSINLEDSPFSPAPVREKQTDKSID